MSKILSPIEARVLSVLVEKQITTPEYYPLTINATVQACNQKSNRDPMMSLSESEVTQALDTLRDKNLVYVFYGSTSRVPKYKHMLPEVFELNPQQVAVLTALMLRGHQTVGELKERAGRLAEFSNLNEVEEVLRSLVEHEQQPFAVRLPRQPGQKDSRYAHLLSGEIALDEHLNETFDAGHQSKSSGIADRLAKLESENAALRAELTELRERMETFIKQFEA